MTNQYPPSPHQAPGYGQPGPVGYPQPYPMRPVRRTRPPLTSGQKRAALWAGAIGYPLMSLGFVVVMSLLGWSLVAGIVRGVAAQIGSRDAGATHVVSELDAMWSTYWWAVVLVLLVGIVIWAIGYGASIGIAKIGNVHRATGTTWAGLGIASVAGVILLWIGYVIYMFGMLGVAMLSGNDAGSGDDAGSGIAIYSVVFAVLSIAIWAVAGALSWWWMAYCLRARHPAQRYPGEPYYV